jgi:hypothetical protein
MRQSVCVWVLSAIFVIGFGRAASAADPAAKAPADPLAARAHVPMPWRLVGVSFISVDKGEPGWAPGPMAEGYYLAEFDTSGLVWRHTDFEEHYACKLGEDGAFVATSRSGQLEGRVDVARGELTWQGKKYRVRTYDETAKEKAAEKPAPLPAGAVSPVTQPDKNTIVIDLKSEQRGGGGFNFAMGMLQAEYLGHQGEWAILRVHTNIEMGVGETLYRLPISDGTAIIQSKNGGMPTYSFDATKGRKVWGGVSRGGNGLGWTRTKEDIEQNNAHWIVEADGKSISYVSTVSMQPGTGAEVKPGAKVRLRLWFYTDRDYLTLRPDAKQGEEITFTVGPWKDEKIKQYMSDGVSTAMDGVVRGMKAGGWRRASMNQLMAKDLEKLVPNLKAKEVLCLEANLLAVEGGGAEAVAPAPVAPKAGGPAVPADKAVDPLRVAAVAKALNEAFPKDRGETLYVEPSPYLPASLDKVGACRAELMTQAAFQQRFKDAPALKRPVFVQVGVTQKEGEAAGLFHVTVSHRGGLGTGVYLDCTFKVEGGKAVLVTQSGVME